MGVGLRVEPDGKLDVHFRSNAHRTENASESAPHRPNRADPDIFFGALRIFGKPKAVLRVGWAVEPGTVVGSSVNPGAPKKSLSRHRTNPT